MANTNGGPIVQRRSILPPSDQYLTALVVLLLGVTLLAIIIGGICLASQGKSIPDAIIAIGSVCAGGLAGMLVPIGLARRQADQGPADARTGS